MTNASTRTVLLSVCMAVSLSGGARRAQAAESDSLAQRPRVIVTTDGEADDRCSMVRFLLSSNEFDVEAIVNSSSQFHWEGGEGWNAFHPPRWIEDQIGLYRQVYQNLQLHDPNYPSPDRLLSRWKVGNIGADGEDQTRTEGAELIAQILLDDSDPRPVWVQAWGGCNTIARALRVIQEEHPLRMEDVAARLHLFLIWEQDESYQNSIRPAWERLNVTTIISDQFDCMAYIWPKVLPTEPQRYFQAEWMRAHILENHGPLCAAYESNGGAFHAEGDTPAFLHAIPNGLRSVESPGWGGWGGRYVNVRGNVWMDPPPLADWNRPAGRWGFDNSWSKRLENATAPNEVRARTQYFKPIWRWLAAVQNDLAARADWCVKPYEAANHPPHVVLQHALNLKARPGDTVRLSAQGTRDPDGDEIAYRWWHFQEAGTYPATIAISHADRSEARLEIPLDAAPGATIHAICEVTDHGVPPLTRYARVVVEVQ
ncbi:MAG: DUF1593 domain-containing protein [Planctomycetales bacterium]|nr:DUF1593 domain-containing protein [Planctomycetales bacterium]